MKNIRWANSEHIGICYDDGVVTVYLDYGQTYQAIINGEYGPIGEPVVIDGGSPIVYTPEEAAKLRLADYAAESDPIYFKWQRGEATQQDWLSKIEQIKARYPITGE